MLKPNEWTFWIEESDLSDDGVFALSISDDVLDPDCWPVWCIVMQGGVVVQLHDMFRAEVHDRPDMMDWTKKQIADWVHEENGSAITHPQVSHSICWMTAPEKKNYWFTVAIGNDHYALLYALAILSSYKVQMEIVGDGDNAEYILVNGETRDGDLVLAEMCFSGNTWHQEKVCPVCEDAGETICGHMHFNKYHEPAF